MNKSNLYPIYNDIKSTTKKKRNPKQYSHLGMKKKKQKKSLIKQVEYKYDITIRYSDEIAFWKIKIKITDLKVSPIKTSILLKVIMMILANNKM